MTDGNNKISSENNEEGGSAPKRQRIEAENNQNAETNDQQHLTLQVMYDMCQEVLEKQTNIEKSNKEIVEKLRLTDEKLESIQLQLKSDKIDETTSISSNSQDSEDSVKTTSSSDSSQAMIPREIMPTTGKYFVLKHVFKNVSKLKENQNLCSEVEEHFGIGWNMRVYRKKEHFSFFLVCSQSLDTGKWIIEVRKKLVFISNRIEKVREDNSAFTNIGKRCNTTGWPKFIEWDVLEKDFLVDDQLTAEIHVKIKNTAGIYKDNLRSFDETMEEFSDVVLDVNEQKFYVLKLYLAAHSPYFKALFLGNFNDSKKSEIKLTGIGADDFQKYLELLYGEHPINEYTCEGLLLVADMLDTPLVRRKCEKFLLEKTEKTLKKKLELSARYNLESLKKKCLAGIKSIDDLQDVLPGNVQDLDKSLMGELLEKAISLHN
ncbi:hypothetical protein GCK72_007415 [Caenorhabditis remanei]|uniref:BTB domain-containing protein n=1 Tax=Caenorhabditis remanei TaxID=31234 RepID=A0A6A5HL98_CAERE|nr:hypothetical protein GCK72_007415 [Caenorhabditis remanei]KAF1767456.1 hypothetical protein GCK72_007415 [Caenorhabditis remanei]